MIDISAEAVVSLTEAAKRLPRRRKGRRPNVATLYRWGHTGCKGVILETLQVGGTKCTSLEALQRFCERLTKPEMPPAAPAPQARQAAIDRADRELADAGI